MSLALAQESRTLENLSSSLRIMRLVRLVRVLWHMRSSLAQWTQLRELRILMTSLSESVKVMAWLAILVFSGIYVASLVMTEGVWRNCPNPETELLCQKFGTLFDSMITFFQIQFSGLLWSHLWDEVQSLEWIFQAAFLSYVGFTLLIVANTITSFVCSLQTNVTKRERELLIDSELDFNERLVRQLYAIFRDFDQNGNGAVSWTEFQLALQDERMQAFLSALELDMSDAVKVFHILASDSTGAIEESDFLLGCLRLRGGATAVDMVRIQMEQEWMHSALQQTRAMAQRILHVLASDFRNNVSPNEQQRILGAHSASLDHVSDSESSEDPIHNFHRTDLMTWQRAVTLQELRTLNNDVGKLCHGWRDAMTGDRILPSDLNLYQFSYHYILPKTAPKEGIRLRIPWGEGKGNGEIPLPGQEVQQVAAQYALPKASGTVLRADLHTDADGEVLDVFVEMHQGRFTVGDADLTLSGSAWAAPPLQVLCQTSISNTEFLSSAPCVAEWYCSHWWGEPIFSFVRCCQHQANVRHLSDQNARYWVCGYANRQHELELEITEDVTQSSFFGALRKSNGLLLILDQDATPFSRIWCDFELYTAIMDPSMGLDIVTTVPGTRGTGPERGGEVRLLSKNLIPGESAVAKSVREQNFPLVMLDQGLEVLLEDGDATHVEDKRAILRSIARSSEILSDEGKKRLATNLACANQTLHSTLAILTWPQAMHKGLLTKPGDRKQNVCRALSSDMSRESLELSLAHFGQSCGDAAVKVLAESLPPNLVKLKLSFEGCTRLTDVSLRTLATCMGLPLKNLYLDFVGCENLTDAGLQVLASSLPSTLEELELHFAGCVRLYSPGVRSLHSNLPVNLKVFKATFRGTGVNANFSNRAELRSFVEVLET